MKLFEHIIDEADSLESYKLFGITLMEKGTVQYRRAFQINKALSKVYKRFLGRIIYKARYYNHNGLFKREISVFSIPVLETLKLNGFKLYFVLGIKVYSKPLKFLCDFKSECLDGLDKKYDDIYIILRHLGDAFQMLTILNGIIKDKQSKHPLIMVFDDSFEDLIKMMNLGVPCLKIQTTKPFKARMETQFSTNVFRYGGYRFILLWNKWWWVAEYGVKKKLLPPDTHVMDTLANALNVSYESHSMGKLEIIPEAESAMLEKSFQAGLNIENFVFIAPESFYLQMYYDSFWENIIGIFQSSGYDIFLNTVTSKAKIKKGSYTTKELPSQRIDAHSLESIPNVKSFYLTVAEAYALACRAKKIISQRSGFSELLVQTNAPMCVIYTGTNRNATEKFKITYSLLGAPFADANKIHELNIVGMDVSDSIKAVCDMLHINHSVNS